MTLELRQNRDMISRLQSAMKRVLKLNGFEFESRSVGNANLTVWKKRAKERGARAGNAGRRVLIVPGFGDTPMSWLPVLGFLAAKSKVSGLRLKEVCVVELSGNIGSLRGQTGIGSMDLLVEALAEVIRQVSPDLLVGQSMGGFLAARYASELQPGASHLERLVLLCPAGMALGEKEQAAWKELLERMSAGEVDSFVEDALGPPPRFPLALPIRRVISKEFRRFLLREESQSLLRTFDDRFEMRKKASRIAVPTTLLWGEADKLIPVAAFHLWEESLGQGLSSKDLRAVRLPKVGHGIHLEAPRTVAGMILSGLRHG